MSFIKMPGLTDIHCHMREPGETHKEDWGTGTLTALAGGFTTVFAMPNTVPPTTNELAVARADKPAREKAHCDYGLFFGATEDNFLETSRIASKVVGLKMYLGRTHGRLFLSDPLAWERHFESCPDSVPIAIHAEGEVLDEALKLAAQHGRQVHVCHVSKRDEILAVRKAKESGWKVTCEVTPHHLFLCKDDMQNMDENVGRVSPSLGTADDQKALWENLDAIDCFATDHAPHLLDEKKQEDAPPGFPSLDLFVPLLITAVHAGRLSLSDITQKLHMNPNRIFGIKAQPDTFIEIDPNLVWYPQQRVSYSRCGWSPYVNARLQGFVVNVVLRGVKVVTAGTVHSLPGSGQNVKRIDNASAEG